MRRIFCFFFFSMAVLAQPGRGPAPVGITQVIQQSIRSSISLTGTIQPVNSTLLASEISGSVAVVHITPGMAFTKGDIVLELDRTYLGYMKDAAQASMEEGKANWDLAKLQEQRSLNMIKKEIISQDDFDTFKLNSVAAKARFEQAKAVFYQLEYQVDQTQVRVPYDGILTEQHVFVGNWVRQGDPVASLVSTQGAEVWVQIPEQYFSNSLSGIEVEISFPQSTGHTQKGTIRALVPQANSKSHTFPIVIDTANGGHFGFGMMVKTEIPTGETLNSLLVPKDAVSYQGNQANVWIVNADASIRMEPVQTGQSAGAWIAVDGGIKEGDNVITRGNERLFPGMTVAPDEVGYDLP